MAIRTKLIDAGTTSWVVPAGIYKISLVGCLGPGGNGKANDLDAGPADSSGGGGGGAWAQISDLDVEPGQTISVNVGTSSSADRRTWFRNTSTVLAAPGGSTTSRDPGVGGLSTDSVGTLKYSGGGGGTANTATNWAQRAGGGGSAGPSGDGKKGADCDSGYVGRAGGGSNGGSSTDGVGQDGGFNTFGSGRSASYPGDGSEGAGSNGGSTADGYKGGTQSLYTDNSGEASNGIVRGPGGGGSGSYDYGGFNGLGGYGGGGGGGKHFRQSGGNGFIVVQYDDAQLPPQQPAASFTWFTDDHG